MADSDNSRTLPGVASGDFYSFVGAYLPTSTDASTRRILSSETLEDDPAIGVWQKWCRAWQVLSESTTRQQRLEGLLLLDAFPTPHDKATCGQSYDAALDAEEQAAAVESEAAEELWRQPALSIAGAAAKLQAIVAKGQPSATSQDEPWPQLRDVITDLLTIDAASPTPGGHGCGQELGGQPGHERGHRPQPPPKHYPGLTAGNGARASTAALPPP